jgi:hypothetical protein
MDDLVDYSISDRVAGMPLRLKWVVYSSTVAAYISHHETSISGQLPPFH